jgi:hypothetical protein
MTPPPIAEKVHFLMLKYDPATCPRKELHKIC